MIKVSRELTDGDLSAEIEKTFSDLESPTSYMAGRYFGQPVLPQNILAFSRRKGSSLLLGSNVRQQHHRYVLITAVKGGGRIGVDTCTHSIKQGESLLVLPFQTHWYVELDDPEFYWIFVTFEHERDSRLEAMRNRGAIRDPHYGLTDLRDFLVSWHVPDEHDTVRLRLATWLHNLSRQASRKHQPVDLVPVEAGDGDWVAEINRFVFERREQNLPLQEIARHLKISTSILRSRFREVTGRSVGAYIRALKLQYACELLHETQFSISDVSERCGYESVFSFSRAFYKNYGMRPTAYRKKYNLVSKN